MSLSTKLRRAHLLLLASLGLGFLEQALGDDAPSNVATAPPILVTVDWSNIVGHTTPTSYGLNGFTAFDPVNAANPKYQQNLAYLGAGLIRFHSWDMITDSTVNSSGWLDIKNQKWDATKIEASLASFKDSKAALLINIPGFPSWLKTNDDILDTAEVKNFADFCAELVRIVNIQNGNKVKYWEITNERDDPYWIHPLQNSGTVRVAALADIYNQCSLAMKAVDPTIKTGGPAAARPDYLDQMREFAKDTLPNLDFFSFHAYASGSADDSDLSIFEKAKAFGDRVGQIRKMLDEVSPNRHIPLQLNEYNISWTWQTQDVRMKNYKGAVFDALALISMANGGADATCAWNERDGVYGKMDADYNLRPSAQVFHLLNMYGVGDIISTSLSPQDRVTAFAIQNPTSGNRLLLLINESKTDRTLNLNPGNWSGEVDTTSIGETGCTTGKSDLASLASGYTIPGHSILFLVKASSPKPGT